MTPFKPEDIINCRSYEGLCDNIWNDPTTPLPKSGIVHVPLDNIVQFFKRIKGTSEKYVLISSRSDFGLTYQSEHPVWRDMHKWVALMSRDDLGYKEAHIPPRCEPKNCNLSDKYSVKCHSYTSGTFDEVPSNISSWFCTNAMLEGKDERITGIPFGVSEGTEESFADSFNITDKKLSIYINFENYTHDRFELKYWSAVNPNVYWDLVTEPKEFKDYLEDLKKYAYVVCPYGNGWDCYRTLETIYCGSVPIMDRGPIPYHLAGLPLIAVGGIREHLLSIVEQREMMYNEYIKGVRSGSIDFKKAKLPYWEGEVKKKWMVR